MKSKTAAWATWGSSTTEAQHRQKNEAPRQEIIQALLSAAIILGVAVTIFAPQLQAFVAGLFTAVSR